MTLNSILKTNILLVCFFFFNGFFNWRSIVDLQYCISLGVQQNESVIHIHIFGASTVKNLQPMQGT